MAKGPTVTGQPADSLEALASLTCAMRSADVPIGDRLDAAEELARALGVFDPTAEPEAARHDQEAQRD